MSPLLVRTPAQTTVTFDAIHIGERIRGVVQETLPALVESISEIGLLYPILLAKDGTLIDGEQRLAALAILQYTDIPVIVAEDDEGELTAEGVLASRLRRELASNGVRTAFTPVQAAAARRRLRELTERGKHTRTGVPLAERRKGWASELATSETGISRTTMDRVDRIIHIAEDSTQPMSVRREAAEGLTRIDAHGAPVDRVLKDVELTMQASSALERYPALAVLPTPAAQVALASRLDGLDEQTRQAQLDAVQGLWGQNPAVVADFQLLKEQPARIGELLTLCRDAAGALHRLESDGHLTDEIRHEWAGIATSLQDTVRSIQNTLNQEPA